MATPNNSTYLDLKRFKPELDNVLKQVIAASNMGVELPKGVEQALAQYRVAMRRDERAWQQIEKNRQTAIDNWIGKGVQQ